MTVEMKKLSFILPCYNVERFISSCLDSIYAQNMSEDEFEVICVDDCSLDGTCAIIEEWQKSYSNLQLIRHAKNSYSGIARNTGIINAKGDYLCFVDADDILPKSVMKDILSIAQADFLEILLYNNVIFSQGVFSEESIKFSDSEVLSGGDYIEKCLKGNIGKLGAPWAKLFKRSFLLQHSIWFSNLIVSQDVPFVWETMICANRVKSISKNGYIFRNNENSTTSNLKRPHLMYSNSILYPNVLMGVLEKYGNDIPCVIRKGVVNEISTEINGFFCKYLSYGEEGKREIYSMIRQKTAPVWNLNEYMHRKQKMAFLSRNLGFDIFDAVVRRLFV